MKIPSKHLNTLSCFTRNKITTKQKQSVIKYVCRVSDKNADCFDLFTVNHVRQREKMNPRINRCRMDVNFSNFFSVKCCTFSPPFALHNTWVKPGAKDCTHHLQIMVVLVVSLYKSTHGPLMISTIGQIPF